MGRVGAAGDNAAMESFFSLMQKNVLNRQPWATRENPRIAIVTWIERTYHRRRRQDSLGRLTPIEYEAIMTPPSHSGCVTHLSPDRAADPHGLPGCSEQFPLSSLRSLGHDMPRTVTTNAVPAIGPPS
jgi:putative transposase